MTGHDSYTQDLSRRIDEAYNVYKPGDPESEQTLYQAFREQAHNIVSYTPELDPGVLEREIARKALIGVTNFRGKARISTWFYRIAKNAVKSAIKKRSENRDRLLSLTTATEGEDGERILNNAAQKAYRTGEQARFAELDAEKLSRNLPKKQAEVLSLLAEGYSLEQIAKLVGNPIGTIRSRYRLAKEKMGKIAKWPE